MRTPPLIGWRLAQIAPLAVARKDEISREVIPGQSRVASVSLRCQVDENSHSRKAVAGGSDTDTQRTIVFRVADAAAAGYTPQHGDLVTSFTDRLGNVLDSNHVYLSNPRKTASGVMADSLWRADLADRSPARRES